MLVIPDTESTPPRSNYFEKPEIAVVENEVLVFTTLKNEVMRLPYFLGFDRERGINHLFIINNASNDGSGEFLKKQPDMHYSYTTMSYKGSSALYAGVLCPLWRGPLMPDGGSR